MRLYASTKRLLPPLALLLCLVFPACAGEQPPSPSFDVATITLETTTAQHSFTVELAQTPAQAAYGLMFRRYLAPDKGMLFFFTPPRPVSMWMKNTYIPLDMLFFDQKGVLVATEQNTVPHSEKIISPDADHVFMVLEVPAGTVKRLSLDTGTRLLPVR
jgi:uncharacterized protein